MISDGAVVTSPAKNFARGSVDRNVIALRQYRPVGAERALLIIDLDPARAANANFAHLPRDQCGV